MTVSVICPVYNTRPDELAAAAASVLGQLGDGELLLVDDASTNDQTIGMVHALAEGDTRVRLIRSEKNGGPGAARSLGLDHASRTWIGFVDADDLWPDQRLTATKDVIAEWPTAQWIIGDIANLSSAGLEASKPGLPCLHVGSEESSTPTLTHSIILNGLHLGTSLIRREAIGPRRFDPNLIFAEDMVFLIKLSLSVPARRSPALSYACRRQHDSLMYSERRLTYRFVQGWRAMMADPELRSFRKPIRWRLYSVLKDLAMNNLINGSALTASRFASEAYLLDPREIRDAVLFVQMLVARHNSRSLLPLAKFYSDSDIWKRDEL